MPPSSGSEPIRKLSPFVYWAQAENTVSLRISLQALSDPEIVINESEIDFWALGIGENGQNEYSFQLKFFKDIESESAKVVQKARSIEVSLEKKDGGWWPRLTKDSVKLQWLKLDFDKLQTYGDEDDDEEVDENEPDDYQLRRKRTNKILSEIKNRKKKYQQRVESFRKFYLFVYNFTQFVGFLYIFIVLNGRYAQEGPAFMSEAFKAVSVTFHFVQLLQILELIHPLLGYTSGSVIGPFLQVSGRLVILLAQLDAEPRVQTMPAVFYLLNTYAISEILRYPYYMGKIYHIKFGLLTWLRYTMWIVLYPLGFLCEGIVILRNIPYFEETKKLSIFLPNRWNISFYYPTFMRMYLLLGLFPLMYFMMTYMYHQRKKILGKTTKKE